MKRHEFILTIPPQWYLSHTFVDSYSYASISMKCRLLPSKARVIVLNFYWNWQKEVGNSALQLVGALMLYDLVVATRDGRLKEEWEAWQKSGRHSEMRGIRAILSAYKYRGGFTKSFRQLFCHYSLWPDGLWKEYTGACMPLSVVHFISQCQEEDLSVLFHNMVLCVHTMQLGNCGCD
jgi:hypothetical protein